MDNNGSLEALAKDFWVSLNRYPTAHLHGIRKALYAFIIERGRHWFRDPFMLNVHFTSHALYFSAGSEPCKFVHRKWMNSETAGFMRRHWEGVPGASAGITGLVTEAWLHPRDPCPSTSLRIHCQVEVSQWSKTLFIHQIWSLEHDFTLPQEVRPTKGQDTISLTPRVF